MEAKGLISANVGADSPNRPADVRAVIRRLYELEVITAAEYAALYVDPDEDRLADVIARYQRRIFRTFEDGIIEVGRTTEDNLIKRNRGKLPAGEAPPAWETLTEIYEQYVSNSIDMPLFAAKVKPFLLAEPAGVSALLGKLPSPYRENLAYNVGSLSRDKELAAYDEEILELLVRHLSPGVDIEKLQARQQLKERIEEVLEDEQAEEVQPYYTIYDPEANALLRDENGRILAGRPFLARWIRVRLDKLKEISDDLTIALVKSEDGSKTLGWTNLVNLYEQFWNPADHREAYEAIDKGYAEAMLRVNPSVTRKATRKSGWGVKAVIDQYYPNSRDINELSSEFRPDLKNFLAYLGSIGIIASITAGLRHPLRSLVFDCAINAALGNEELLMRAQAMSVKYGIPIDWLHYNSAGRLDLLTSKRKAEEVKAEFGIGSAAARGVRDFGGKISNHNLGNGVDLSMVFTFSEKTVTRNGKQYKLNAAAETPRKGSGGRYLLPNCANKPLARLGKEQFNVTRALDDDAIHWSKTGR